MSAIIVFFAAMLCILFFLIGTIVNAFASWFKGLLDALGMTFVGALFFGITLILLLALYGIVEGVRSGGWGSVGGMVALILLDAFVVFLFFGPIGAAILSLVTAGTNILIGAIRFVLEGAAGFIEIAYLFFWGLITSAVDKDSNGLFPESPTNSTVMAEEVTGDE